MSDYGLILSYMAFIGILVFLIDMGAPVILENVPAHPVWPAAPGAWDYLIFIPANIGYFFSLLLVTSTTYPLLGVLIFSYTVAFFYMVLKLIRGN